jgi:dephospho-CoA kinase
MDSIAVPTDPQRSDAGVTGASTPPIGRYRRVPVQIHEADPDTPEVARRLIALISTRWPGTPAEHIGSSAVPGLAGKNIIDLLLAAEPAHIPAITQALLELGFQPQVPAAFPATRPMLWGAFRHGPTEYRVHVHVVPAGSPEVAAMRGFRDALRADPLLRRRYAALKRAIVEGGPVDPVTFTKAKHDWIVTALTQLGLATHQPRRLYQDDLGLDRSLRLAS